MPAGPNSPPQERLWLARLRWRLRGATQAPLFVVLVLAEAVLLNRLPVAGEHGADLVGGLLLAAFLNLVVVAIVAPVVVVVRRHRRRRADRSAPVPTHVARDRMASAIMLGLAALLLVGGVVHRSSVRAGDEDYARGLAAARTWILDQRADLHPMIGTESVWKAGDHFYRTCVRSEAGRDRNLCLFVDTSESVPTVRLDRDQQSNAFIAGPDNPAQQGH